MTEKQQWQWVQFLCLEGILCFLWSDNNKNKTNAHLVFYQSFETSSLLRLWYLIILSNQDSVKGTDYLPFPPLAALHRRHWLGFLFEQLGWHFNFIIWKTVARKRRSFIVAVKVKSPAMLWLGGQMYKIFSACLSIWCFLWQLHNGRIKRRKINGRKGRGTGKETCYRLQMLMRGFVSLHL